MDYSKLFKTNYRRLPLWKTILKNQGKKLVIAEIGVWQGSFCKFLLKECPNIEKYYLIDPWRHLDSWNKPLNVENQKFDKIYNKLMKELESYSDKVVILRGTTEEIISKIKDESLDFVYIDGDHTLNGITTDLNLMYPKMKMGSLIAGDDFVSNYNQHGSNFSLTMVKPVVTKFCQDRKLTLFSNHNQFLFIKK